MQPNKDSPVSLSSNIELKSDEKTEFIVDLTASKTPDEQVENYNDELYEQFSDLKSKIR